jgi:protein phosphatase
MRWEQKIQYATLSDVGMRRKNNQDSFSVQLCSENEVWQQFGHLFVVADGMGGHAVGELASKMAVDTIPLTFYKGQQGDVQAALQEAIERANHVIHERGSQNVDFNRMGTTCVVLVLTPHGAILGHVGDSRCYRVRGDKIEQLTFDHSLHWELQRQGRVKPGDVFLPEAKHVITRSLGPESKVDVDINGPHVVLPNDRFVLCSDGLTGHVSDAEIGMVVRELSPSESSKLLVNLANLRGGSDNTTVVVTSVDELPDGLSDASVEAFRPTMPPVGTAWTFGFWLSVGMCGLGAVLGVLSHEVIGATVASIGLFVMLFLLRRWYKSRPKLDPDKHDPKRAQVFRTASARTTKEFLAGLAKLSSELRKMAIEESWKIDWDEHDKTINDAREALDKKRPNRAMSLLGRVLDLLTQGLHHHRKMQRLTQDDS